MTPQPALPAAATVATADTVATHEPRPVATSAARAGHPPVATGGPTATPAPPATPARVSTQTPPTRSGARDRKTQGRRVATAESVWPVMASVAVVTVLLVCGLGRWLAAPATDSPELMVERRMAVVRVDAGETVRPRAAEPVVAQMAGPGVASMVRVVPVDVVLAQSGRDPGAGISLEQFLNNLRWWLVGMLATLTIAFLSLGAVRLIIARGEPEEYEKAKAALRSALYGYIATMLAPAIVGVLQSLFSGGR